MSNNCCIGLCIKNSANGLPAVFANIDKIQSLFNKMTIIISYDHSHDGSLTIIKEYISKRREDVKIIVLNVNSQTYNSKRDEYFNRTIRIANARNLIMHHIYKYNNDDEYFIMMDTNDYSCISPIDKTVLDKCLKSNEWDGLSFNRRPYYDLWALSINPLVVSCWHFKNTEKSLIAYNRLLSNKLNVLKNDELLPVISAFGGFAIYRTNKFLNCKYSGQYNPTLFSKKQILTHSLILDSAIMNNKPDDCEHRSFHIDAIVKNSARIRISPMKLFPDANNFDESLTLPQCLVNDNASVK